MNVIVLGSTGFIGKNIISSLNKHQIKNSGFGSLDVDLTKKASIKFLSKKITSDTTIIFAAAITRQNGDNLENMKKNIAMAINVAEAFKISKPKQCVYLSTCDVYGFPKKTITEETKCSPQTFYAKAKYSSELTLTSVCKEIDAPLLILRYNGIFGPGQINTQYGPNRFILESINDNSIMLWGNGEEKRDLVYVKDLAEIVVRLIAKDKNGIFNIATGKSLTFYELAKKVIKILNKDIKIENRERTSALFNQYFDNSKLTSELPDVKFINLNKALKNTLNWYLRNSN